MLADLDANGVFVCGRLVGTLPGGDLAGLVTAAATPEAGLSDAVELIGVDHVGAFDPAPAGAGLRLICAPALAWTPTRSFDLITSVHGMHFLGDKLALLSRAAGWLTPTGRFVADLDLSSIRLLDGAPAGRRLTARLRPLGSPTTRGDAALAAPAAARSTCPTPTPADHRAGPNYALSQRAHRGVQREPRRW